MESPTEGLHVLQEREELWGGGRAVCGSGACLPAGAVPCLLDVPIPSESAETGRQPPWHAYTAGRRLPAGGVQVWQVRCLLKWCAVQCRSRINRGPHVRPGEAPSLPPPASPSSSPQANSPPPVPVCSTLFTTVLSSFHHLGFLPWCLFKARHSHRQFCHGGRQAY